MAWHGYALSNLSDVRVACCVTPAAKPARGLGGAFSQGTTAADGDSAAVDLLLPTHQDPKLWHVNCKPGKERDVATCLMQVQSLCDSYHTRSIVHVGLLVLLVPW